MAVLKLEIPWSSKSLFFFSAEIFALEWYSGAKKIEIRQWLGIYSAIFDGKVSTAFELSFRTCFQIIGSSISLLERSSTWLNSILSVRRLHALLSVFVKVEHFCVIFENSNLLYNRSTLLSLKTCQQAITIVVRVFYYWRWRCMFKMKNRDRNTVVTWSCQS